MKQLILLLAIFLLGEAQAGELWNWNATAQTTLMSYSGSPQRKAAGEMGVLLSGDYLDDGGFTFGYTRTVVQLQQALANINQNELFVSARRNIFLDSARGEITLRADGHRIRNDDASTLTDDVRAAALQAAYLVYDKQYCFDLGYARSRYAGRFTVNQYTPGIGYAMQEGAGWLQLRSYLIAFSDTTLAQGISRTRALEAKYSYWLLPGNRFKPGKIQFSALGGKRLYAVDMDAGAVGNLSDLQTGAVALSVEWDVGRNNKLMVLGGQNRYENVSLGNKYRGNFLYANWNSGW